jgi:hypothetical protein
MFWIVFRIPSLSFSHRRGLSSIKPLSLLSKKTSTQFSTMNSWHAVMTWSRSQTSAITTVSFSVSRFKSPRSFLMVSCLDRSSNLSDVGGCSFGCSNLRTIVEFLKIGSQHTLMPFLSSLCTGPLCFFHESTSGTGGSCSFRLLEAMLLSCLGGLSFVVV